MSNIIDHPLMKIRKNDSYENKAAYDKLITSRFNIINNFPFWGIIGLELSLVEETPSMGIKMIPTLATDGRQVIYNAEFINSLSQDEVTFALAHEFYHVVFDHVGKNSRMGERHAQLWNVATDYCINQELKESGIGKFITSIKILYDSKYKGMFSEEVYELLLEEIKKNPNHQFGNTLDKHIIVRGGAPSPGDMEGGEVIHQDENVTIVEKNGNITVFDKNFNPSEYEKDLDETIKKAVSTQEEAERKGLVKDAGRIPSNVARYIDRMGKSRHNWKNEIKKFTDHIITKNVSFSRPNKTFFNTGITFPSRRQDSRCLDMAIAFDTSGSVSNVMISRYLTELKAILKQWKSYKLHIWSFDGHVHEDSYMTLTNADMHNDNALNNIQKFLGKMKGGGGTIFEDNWRFMKEKKIKPKGFMLFTDGYPCDSWGDQFYAPTVFLIANDTYIKAPYGKTIMFDLNIED